MIFQTLLMTLTSHFNQTQPSQILKVPPSPNKVAGPECGQEFCRLGCVCSSLQHLNRGHLHCRRPECMFGCACFKRKITKQTSTGESQEHPVYCKIEFKLFQYHLCVVDDFFPDSNRSLSESFFAQFGHKC